MWLLWSLGVPWEEMPEHSRLFLSLDWCRLYRVWPWSVGSWWDTPCLCTETNLLIYEINNGCLNIVNRRSDFPLFLLSELLMWRWSIWTPGELPSSSGRNIQMWVSFTMPSRGFVVGRESPIFVIDPMSNNQKGYVCSGESANVSFHVIFQVFPVIDWDNTPACAVRWDGIYIQLIGQTPGG